MTRRKVLIKIFLFNWSYSSDRFKSITAYSNLFLKVYNIYFEIPQFSIEAIFYSFIASKMREMEALNRRFVNMMTIFLLI